MPIETQPVAKVEWIERERLTPNEYNPNQQPPPEHRLLRVSILEDGWTQPIVVFDDGSGGPLVIVDGEHRWRMSADPEVRALTNGMVPIVRIKKQQANRMMSTIRHNRARGEHGILPMARIVQQLLEEGFTIDDLGHYLQMEDEEVLRLAERAGMPTVIVRDEGAAFNQGWKPK